MSTKTVKDKKSPAKFNVQHTDLYKYPVHIYKLIKDSKTDLIYNQDVADKFNAFIDELIGCSDIIRDTYVQNKYQIISIKGYISSYRYIISVPYDSRDTYYSASDKKIYNERLENVNNKWIELYELINPTLTEYLNMKRAEEINIKREKTIKTDLRKYAKKMSQLYQELDEYRQIVDRLDPDRTFRTKYHDCIMKDYGVTL